MSVTIEDVESRTLLQQFHKLFEKQKETQEELDGVSGDLEQETQNRTNADIGLQESIQAIQRQLDALGNVFTLKGSVATVNDLPAENNKVGDVYYVVANSSGYVWIDDNGTERWEQLGLTVDMSNYATKSEVETGLAGKQDTLTAGTNISIIDNVISASGGVNPDNFLDLTKSTQQDATGNILIGLSDRYKKIGFLLDASNKIEFAPHQDGNSGNIIHVLNSAYEFNIRYNATNRHFIHLYKNGNSYDLLFPQKTGTLALTDDCKIFNHAIKLNQFISINLITRSNEQFTVDTLKSYLQANEVFVPITAGNLQTYLSSNDILEKAYVGYIATQSDTKIVMEYSTIDFANSNISRSIHYQNILTTGFRDTVTEI